jgi:prephenate dehydratase
VAEGSALAGAAPHAAIGTRHAAGIYGATVLAEGIEDDPENATRFAWIARADAATAAAAAPPASDGAVSRETAPGRAPAPTTARESLLFKTALVFWGGGDLAPGWLVDCLTEFSSRAINLTRIESRPRRIGLGHYMFFCDLEGAATDAGVAAAIAGLRGHCETVRVLGSFPAFA